MIDANSRAAGVGVTARNVQFQSEATNVPRKVLILGTFLPANASVVENTPRLVLSPEDCGSYAGFGSMLHRLSLAVFLGCGGVPVYVHPQAEAQGAAASTGIIDFTGSANVQAGTYSIKIANEMVSVPVAAGATGAAIASDVNAAINARTRLPLSTAVDGGTPGQLNATAKSKGPWGDDITVSVVSAPSGVVTAVTAMAGGAGVPDVEAALAALGTGDGANESFFTDVTHGYGADSTTLDAILAYVGAGNEAVGLYGNTVSRPFRVLIGDTTPGSSGLTDLITLTDGRVLDRASGVVAVPGSATHPAEIAAQATGHMARINQDRAAQHYVGTVLIGVDPGAKADRWTSEYNNRDTAVQSGISPTLVKNGVVTLQNVVSFYRPDNVPVASNGYASMRNISILQNLLYNIRINFEQERWQGISIVADTAQVVNTTDRQKARDVDAVKDDLVALAHAFAGRAWLYEAGFTVGKLKETGAVTIRQGGLGFDCVLSVLLSGEGGILNTVIEFDTSLTVLLNNA